MIQRFFPRIVVVEIILLLLVVLAGSVVRMTGSGMGCPDWPKCFGYLIPPTDVEQVTWGAGKSFRKGQMIVHDEALWQAREDFTAGVELDLDHWEKYTRHDYAIFNAAHTWTEYINRLLGALSGVPMVILLMLSFTYIRTKPLVPLLAIFGVFGLGFEAWLGKVVVDGNLIPGQITYHMMMAIALILAMILLRRITLPAEKVFKRDVPNRLRNLTVIVILMMTAQIIMGTQVREHVDHLVKEFGGHDRSGWIDQMDVIFYVHRSFSLLILGILAYLAHQVKRNSLDLMGLRWAFWLVSLEVVSGAVLAYFEFPRYIQPLHLLLSVGVVMLLFDGILKMSRVGNPSLK
ncbi:MAG: COX15/CtaA family protein [Bacteroidota bacterium]|nr:COX15/CtaA family protein [Bacteroidota bacterium]MDX5426600.1 COX15/CtaA family protein [Bacteroidota bacterium]MDX5449077.1 COX15/CtaA family protein [Bacteroidota bacterium]MDX5504609.1 COX15/CtaA family protein [Bacteroidota bacterium]